MEPGAQGCSRGGVPGDGSGPGRLVLGRKQDDSLGGRQSLVESWLPVTGVAVQLLGCRWRRQAVLLQLRITAGWCPG